MGGKQPIQEQPHIDLKSSVLKLKALEMIYFKLQKFIQIHFNHNK